jgi:putative transposase
LQVLTELKNRGVKDIFIACVDGLKGFPEAIASVYPDTEVQLCIVYLVRASLNYVPWKSRKQVVADLQRIYRAATSEEAEQQLEAVEAKWKTYPSVAQVWRRNWACVKPFFNYPPEIRKAIDTTNSVESLHRSLRKFIKTRGGFPNQEAAPKLLFLGLRQASKKWTMPIVHWREALNHFAILWPRTHACFREVCAMTKQKISTLLSRGRGTDPFPGTPSPKPTPSRLHKILDAPSIMVVLPGRGGVWSVLHNAYDLKVS